MPRNPDWSDTEIELVIDDYFDMLRQEFSGVHYSKTDHRNQLMERLPIRSKGSIEMKHCNISSVLDESGYVSIDGYKPRPHKQEALVVAVLNYVEGHPWAKRSK